MKTVDVSKGEKFPLFNAIDVEIAAKCNRTCVFCPNWTDERPDELMPWWMIEKIVDDLAAVKYSGRFAPYLYNEPTRDKRLFDVIALVTERLPSSNFMISTNGDYFKSAKDIEKLFNAGVRQIVINVYSAADGCGNEAKQARGVEAAKKRHAQIQGWLDEIGAVQDKGMYGHAPRNARRAVIEAKYGVTSDTKKIDGKFQLSNRSGNITHFLPAVPEPLKKMCVRPFRFFSINWKGEAVVCCNDYHGATNLGNVRDHTVEELWNSPRMNQYREFLQRKDRSLPICDTCDYAGGYYTHNVAHVINLPTARRKK